MFVFATGLFVHMCCLPNRIWQRLCIVFVRKLHRVYCTLSQFSSDDRHVLHVDYAVDWPMGHDVDLVRAFVRKLVV